MTHVDSLNARRKAWHARWLMPVISAPIENGAVVVQGDQIVWAGASDQAVADGHEQLGECVLMPGLVNAHSHLELTALRGFLEGLEFGHWLRTLTDIRARVLSAQDITDSARLGVSEALLAGITTIADCTATGASLDAMIDAGIRGRVYLETFGPDRSQVKASMAALRTGVAALRGRVNTLVDVGVSPHAPYTVSDTLFRAVADFATEERLFVASHVAESAAEDMYVREGSGPFAERLTSRGIAVEGTGGSPVELLDRTGLLNERLLCVHAVHANAQDLLRIKSSGATVVHCPISNAKLGQGIAPLLDMCAAGIPVGLGTDSVASNDRMDIVGEARQAVLLQSLQHRTPDALSAADALQLATLGGAQSLRYDALGALAAGYRADLCAFRVDALEAIPVYDPAVLLVHVMGSGRLAALTMVGGRVLVRDGAELNADPGVRRRVEVAGGKVKQFVTSR